MLANNLKGDIKSDVLERLDGQADSYFYAPWKQVKGTGTEKLLHMTYVFQIFVFMQIFN